MAPLPPLSPAGHRGLCGEAGLRKEALEGSQGAGRERSFVPTSPGWVEPPHLGTSQAEVPLPSPHPGWQQGWGSWELSPASSQGVVAWFVYPHGQAGFGLSPGAAKVTGTDLLFIFSPLKINVNLLLFQAALVGCQHCKNIQQKLMLRAAHHCGCSHYQCWQLLKWSYCCNDGKSNGCQLRRQISIFCNFTFGDKFNILEMLEEPGKEAELGTIHALPASCNPIASQSHPEQLLCSERGSALLVRGNTEINICSNE